VGTLNQPTEITEFLAVLRRTPELWRSIDARVLALKMEGEWHNLLTRCYLDSRLPEAVTRLGELPVTDNVGCWQCVLPLSELEGLLTQLPSQEITFGKATVVYRAFMASAGQQQYSFNRIGFSDLTDLREYSSYRHWSCHELSATGNRGWDLIRHRVGGQRAIDNDLRTYSKPFDGLDGLLRHALGYLGRSEDVGCRVEVFAPLEAAFVAEKCALERGQVRFALRARSVEAARHCALGVFAHGTSPVPMSTRLPVPQENWQEGTDELTVEGSISVPGRHSATLILCLGPYAVHRVTVLDAAARSANLRVEAYRVFDSDLDSLTQPITVVGSKNSTLFERAVARLFTFLGFQVDLVSGSVKEAPDLLAYVPSRDICIAVECTTESINSGGKIGKLTARKGQIALSTSCTEVWGVLATSLNYVQLSEAELEAARSDRLAVVAQEDLKELISMCFGAPPMDDVMAFLQARIPPRTPETASSLVRSARSGQ
jgi:hypothetical protein